MSARRVIDRLAALAVGAALLTACGDDGAAGGGRAGEGRAGAERAAVPDASPGDRSATLLVDVAEASGLDFVHDRGAVGDKLLFETMGSGVALSDLDGDGRLDVVLLQSGTLPAEDFPADELPARGHDGGATDRLYLNRGGMRFDDASAGSGIDRADEAMGLAVGDVDADGDRDLWVAVYGPDRLHLNDGTARFSDVSAASGLEDRRWTIGGAFLDADLDGDLDLYALAYLGVPLVGNPECGPSPEQRTYCHVDAWPGLDDRLWLNDGRGVFTDGSAPASLIGTAGKGLAVVGGDYDDDGDTDLFVANDSAPNLMLRNDGGGRFTDVSRESSVDMNGEGRTEACMGADFGDLDGDGDLDLYVVNFELETNTLYRNDGQGWFSDVSTRSGAGMPSTATLGFGTVFADFDVDGDLDVYVANGHIDDNIAEVSPGSRYAQADHLYLNDGRGRFQEAPSELGDSLSSPRVGRGVAAGDLDGDGDADLVVTNNGQRPWLLRNDMGRGPRIALRLRGPGGRADAEGARVVLGLDDGRRLVREVRVGGSYLSSSDTALLVGLGAAQEVTSLEVRWPGGDVATFGPLAAGRAYTLAPDAGLVEEQPLAPPSTGR